MHARFRFAKLILTALGSLVGVPNCLPPSRRPARWRTTAARQIYVDPTIGNDRANGLASQPHGTDAPLKTIARGIALAKPGDTVHLAPVVFRESAVFFNRHGEPGKPITLDGHGAVLRGAIPCSRPIGSRFRPALTATTVCCVLIC